MDVGAWLRGLGLDRYEAAFRDNDIDPALLATLSADDLREMGIASLGHRKRLLAAIAELAKGTKPGSVASATQRRYLTIMFADLAGSTALSRQLDPEDLRRVLTTYQAAVRAAVEGAGGHVAKFVGDGVLAYFGWPRADETAAERAVRAGLAIVAAVEALPSPVDRSLAARVGIASGLVVVGDLLGEGAAREETVFGDTPNLAARLQELAAAGNVVIAESTRALIGEMFVTRPRGPLVLRGFPESVMAHELTGERVTETRFEVLRPGAPIRMIGRDQELALVLERWARARTGEGQAILLVGEAGIGKSRLLQEVVDLLAGEEPVVLRYQCSPLRTGTEFWPVVQHVMRAVHIVPSDDAETKRMKLATMFGDASIGSEPAVALAAEMIGATEARSATLAGIGAAQKRARTFALLIDHLLRLARATPVIIVFEDVHWIDATTLELLSETLDRISQERILMLLTSRPDGQPAIGGHPHLTRLTLNRLGRATTGAIVARLTGERALPDAVIEEIAARTDGVPLFIEELTKAVLETGTAGSATAVPPTLHASLMARLDRVPDVREVAQIAACIGREFGWSLLSAISSLPDAELAAALDRLDGAELVFRRGVPPEATYTFKHALVRDAAHESLLRAQRQEIHGRIVRVIEERFPELFEAEPEVVAEHSAEAGDIPRAIDCRQRAAEKALARSAMKEAIVQLEKGLPLLALLHSGPERERRELRLQRALGQASIAARGFAAPETGAAYARAHELCLAVGEPGEIFPILYGRSVFHFQRGELDRAHAVASELLGRGKAAGDVPAQVAGHRMIGSALSQMGRFAESRERFARALALIDTKRDNSSAILYAVDSRVMSTCWLAQLELILGNRERALEHHARVPEYVAALQSPSTTAVAHAWSCIFLQLIDCPAAAIAEADLAIAVAVEHGYPLYAAAGLVIRGWSLSRKGAADDAAAEISRGIARYTETGAALWTPYFLGLLAEAEGIAGRPAAGLEALEEASRRVQAGGIQWIAPEIHRIRGNLLKRAEGPESAAADSCFETAVTLAREQGAALWEAHAIARE